MYPALTASNFPNIINALDKLHYTSKVQSKFKASSLTDPRMTIVMLMGVGATERHRVDAQREAALIGLNDPKMLIQYMKLVGLKSWPEAEDVIVTDVNSTVEYIEMNKEPFPKGEPVLAQSARASYWYATTVLKKRFPAGEPAMEKVRGYWEEYVSEMQDMGVWNG